MNYRYHIVTPFSRPEHFDALTDHLRPLSVTWHLLVDLGCSFRLKLEYWMRLYPVYPVTPPWLMWRKCINEFARHLDEDPASPFEGDRFLMLSDDTIYEPGFLEKVDAASGEVLVVSLKRGDQIPPGTPAERAHGTNTLVAAPENMRPVHVDSQQIVLSGHLFRRINLPLHPHCDGMLIEQTVNDFGAKYLREAFVWFNYLEPGRWKK